MTSRFGFLLILLAGAACGGSSPSGTNPPPPPPPPAGPPVFTVTIGDNNFGSGNLTVAAGTIVKWENGGLVPHSSTSNTGVWDSGSLSAGFTAGGYFYTGGACQRSFSTAGTYPYHCNFHAAMQGTITVTP